MTHHNDVDLSYRPASYFSPKSLAAHLLTQVSGAERRRDLERLIAEGKLDGIPEFLAKAKLPDEERSARAAIHPALMGGEYLPTKNFGEVEIARIEIASTTSDVTSVFARLDGQSIHLRVVDEYDGGTLTGESEARCERPLSLEELADFFMEAWSLYEVLEMNFEQDVEQMLGFFRAKSDFYPDLDRLLRRRVIERFPNICEEHDEDEQ